MILRKKIFSSLTFSLLICFHAPVHYNVHRAAFDLGSGLFKVVVAEVDEESNRVEKILLEKMTRVNLSVDFKKYGTISQEGEARAIKAIQELVSLAKEYSGEDVIMRGVATATFRKAGERGAEVLANINNVVGYQFIKEISAKAEEEVGLKTALIVVSEGDPERQQPNISWDCGSASFQIAYDDGKKIQAIPSNIGEADIWALYETVILGKPVFELEQMVYVPVTQEQVDTYLNILKEHLSEESDTFHAILEQEGGHVITIGDGGTAFFKMQSLIGKNIYTRDEVKALIDSLIGRPVSEVEEIAANYPARHGFIMPSSLFLYAVMEYYNIESVENFVTIGGTKGLLAITELWDN